MPASTIVFSSEGIKFSVSLKSEVRNWLIKSALREGFTLNQLHFVFCNDDFLLSLNRKFLDHKTLTDILTFDYTSENSPENLSGEIYISIDRVKENAKRFSVDFETELHRVMIHGILHLCGYRDKTNPQKKEMRKKEDFYLALL